MNLKNLPESGEKFGLLEQFSRRENPEEKWDNQIAIDNTYK